MRHLKSQRRQFKPLGSLLRGIFFVLLLGGSFLQQAAWGYEEPELAIETSSPEIPVGARFELRASLKWEGSQSPEFVILKATPPESESIKLLESKTATSSRLTQDGAFSQKSYIFTYETLKAGEVVLDPVLFEITETSDLEQKDLLRTEETSIRILPTWIFYLKTLALPAAGITLLVLTFAGAFLGWGHFRKKRIREDATLHTFDSEKEILKTIHEVNRYQVFGDLKTFYSRMRQSLFNYVEKKYGVSFFDKNESEIQFLVANAQIPEALVALCVQWGNETERVSFGGAQPTRDEQEKLARETLRYFKQLVPNENDQEILNKEAQK